MNLRLRPRMCWSARSIMTNPGLGYAMRIPQRAFAGAAIVLALVLSASSSALAQCAMCGLAAEQAADPATVTRTLGLAALVLLIPVNLVAVGMVVLAWKARDWDGAVFRDEPAAPESADAAADGIEHQVDHHAGH